MTKDAVDLILLKHLVMNNMAKKSNRTKTKSSSRPVKTVAVPDQSALETPPPEVTPDAPRPLRSPKLSRSQAAAERLEDEYAYIAGDLRRVFILAAAMFALLIIANLAFALLG